MSRLLGGALFSFLVPGAQDEGKKSKPLSREGGVTAPCALLRPFFVSAWKGLA